MCCTVNPPLSNMFVSLQFSSLVTVSPTPTESKFMLSHNCRLERNEVTQAVVNSGRAVTRGSLLEREELCPSSQTISQITSLSINRCHSNQIKYPFLKYHQANPTREDVSCVHDASFFSQRGLQMSSDTFFLDKRSLLGDRNCCSDGPFRCCTSRGSQPDILRSFYAHPAFLCPRLSVRWRRHRRQIEM